MKNKKKKYKIITVVAALYLAVVVAVLGRDQILHIEPQSSMISANQTDTTAEEIAKAEQQRIEAEKAAAEAEKAAQDAYNKAMSEITYNKDTAAKTITKADCVSIITANSLPALSRMSAEDTEKLMSNLQVLKRAEVLGYTEEDMLTPELGWKNIYNSVSENMGSVKYSATVTFSGTKVSELNKFVAEAADGTMILISSDAIDMDEPLHMKSYIGLDGQGTVFSNQNNAQVNKAIIADQTTDVTIKNITINGGSVYGIYFVKSKRFDIENCTINDVNNKGLVIMGTSEQFILRNNVLERNGYGAMFLNGDISQGIIENNSVLNSRAAYNLAAGIVLSCMTIEDYYNAENPLTDEYLYEWLDAPNNLVITDNDVVNGNSSGIYSHGGYMNYIINNTVMNNDKEGMCLDCGTFGTYVSGNIVKLNGGRNRQTDQDIANDFITNFGRLADGSSPAKLPGISLDNAAYNILVNNSVNENYGSGIKMVRSSFRNLVMTNSIVDNNFGESEEFHFFGIEFSNPSVADEPVKCLDFTPDFENIVCRNTISGKHYAGIYLEKESYVNDIFDNVIMNSEHFTVEIHTEKFNSIVNNVSNVPNSR